MTDVCSNCPTRSVRVINSISKAPPIVRVVKNLKNRSLTRKDRLHDHGTEALGKRSSGNGHAISRCISTFCDMETLSPITKGHGRPTPSPLDGGSPDVKRPVRDTLTDSSEASKSCSPKTNVPLGESLSPGMLTIATRWNADDGGCCRRRRLFHLVSE